MEVIIPKRHELIVLIPLFIRINPLQRPRANPHKRGSVYQPKENQKELLFNMSQFEPLSIDSPVIIDSYVQYSAGKKEVHPVSKKYGDDDNLRKAINDALVIAGIIEDDRFCVGGETYKSIGDEDFCLIKIWSVGVLNGVVSA